MQVCGGRPGLPSCAGLCVGGRGVHGGPRVEGGAEAGVRGGGGPANPRAPELGVVPAELHVGPVGALVQTGLGHLERLLLVRDGLLQRRDVALLVRDLPQRLHTGRCVGARVCPAPPQRSGWASPEPCAQSLGAMEAGGGAAPPRPSRGTRALRWDQAPSPAQGSVARRKQRPPREPRVRALPGPGRLPARTRRCLLSVSQRARPVDPAKVTRLLASLGRAGGGRKGVALLLGSLQTGTAQGPVQVVTR